MKEGKLSSVYAERYGLSESQNHGTVLWHTLTEDGKMEIYDMKFGNTIIANIPAKEIEPTLFLEHGGSVKRDDDVPGTKRKKSGRKRKRKLTESSSSRGPRGPTHSSRSFAMQETRKRSQEEY